MKPTQKLPLAFLLIGLAIAGWLCTQQARGAIETVLASQSASDVADTVQKWGVTLAIIGALAFAVASKCISAVWALRGQWEEQQNKIEDDRRKRAEMLAEQQKHEIQIQDGAEKIKAVNANLSNPVPTIPPPTKTQPLTP